MTINLAKYLEKVRNQATGMHGETITYNKEQQQFIDTVSRGQSCVLIGPAGTGKTTCSQGGISSLVQSNIVPLLEACGHKYLPYGTPGIAIISFTRRAVNNIRKVTPEDIKLNCITGHKLIEYEPVFYDVEDPETGAMKRSMRFEPTRHSGNPLPPTLHTITCEEASMLGTDLFLQIKDALPHKVQWIFIGDIQQLPPVFGPAILGFAMLQLPVVELTQVYRQALESPILKLAHRILSGNPIPATEFPDWKYPGKLTIHPWKKKLLEHHTLQVLGQSFFPKAIESGDYDPEEDIILIPFNKKVGSIELNKHIANYLARKRQAVTYEIVAGFQKHYYSIGDKILYDKDDAVILDISVNKSYTGIGYQKESQSLDYWGINSSSQKEQDEEYDPDFLLSQVASIGDSEDRVQQASHILTIKMLDSDKTLELTTAGEINSLLHAYVMTVHKAQGSEWNRVFLILHHTHATMLSRELLYTAVTRAREELYIICEPDSLVKGILSQRIKGNSVQEKAKYFKGKVDSEGEKHVYTF